MELRRQRLSQRRKAAERSIIFPALSELQPDGAEVADLFRPQVAPAQPAPVEFARPIDTQATVEFDAIAARSRRVKRFAVLGALAVAGVAAALSPVTGASAPVAVVHSESQAHVAVIPASDLGSSASLAGHDHPAPGTASINNAESSSPAAAAAVPKPPATRNAHRTGTTSQPIPNSSTTISRPDRRPPSAENYLWSHAAEVGEYDQHWKRLTAPRP